MRIRDQWTRRTTARRLGTVRTDDFLAVLFKTALEDLDEGVDDPVNVSQSANMHLFAKSKKKSRGAGGPLKEGGERLTCACAAG